MENENCETGASEPQSLLEMLPIKQGTDQLCESIVNQEGFKELYAKIDAFISDEKLKYEYSTLNERGALLQQKQQAGAEITEEEITAFEQLRTDCLTQRHRVIYRRVQLQAMCHTPIQTEDHTIQT